VALDPSLGLEAVALDAPLGVALRGVGGVAVAEVALMVALALVLLTAMLGRGRVVRRRRGMMLATAAAIVVPILVVVVGRQGPEHERRRSGQQEDVAFHPNLERFANALAPMDRRIIASPRRTCQACLGWSQAPSLGGPFP